MTAREYDLQDGQIAEYSGKKEKDMSGTEWKRAVAEDWKWVRAGLSKPECKHQHTTIIGSEERYWRVCLDCRVQVTR